MMRWVKRVVNGLIGIFLVLMFMFMTGQLWLVQGPLLLVFGWVSFLGRVLPQVAVRWGALAETLGVVAVLGVGLHGFLRWLWPQVRPGEARPWEARWTASLLGLLVLLFCATMATVGIGHQAGWLFSSREPRVVNTRLLERERLEVGSQELCDRAARVLAGDPSGASLARELLAYERTRRSAEVLHTVLVPGSTGVRTLVVFARDPLQREEEGVMRCFSEGGTLERHPASALPRLLAGEAVAGGVSP